MTNTGGLDITTDGGIDMANLGGGSKELNLADAGDVIDPRTIAAEAADAAAENFELENEDEEPERPPLDIIDETGADESDEIIEDELELKDDELEEKPVAKKEVASTEDEEYETFKVLGKHFSDEGILEGFEDEMENTPEALQSMVTKTVEKGIEEYKDSFKHPMAKQFLDYLEDGGDPGKFVNAVSGPDYNGLTAESIDGDTTIQKQLLRDQLTQAGETAEDIEDLITAFEDGGQLTKRSGIALKKLQKAQSDKISQTAETQKATRAEQIQNNQKILTDLKEKIDGSEDIGGFPLTKKAKNDFYKYITEVDSKTGKTGLMADSTDPKNQLLMSYLYYNKFDMGKLEKKSKTKAVRSLEEKLGRYTDGSAKQKSRRRAKVVKSEPGQLNTGPLKKMFG